MDQSSEDAGPSASSPFADAALYPAANMHSKLSEENLNDFHQKYGIDRMLWHIYAADRRDRVYPNDGVYDKRVFGDHITSSKSSSVNDIGSGCLAALDW